MTAVNLEETQAYVEPAKPFHRVLLDHPQYTLSPLILLCLLGLWAISNDYFGVSTLILPRIEIVFGALFGGLSINPFNPGSLWYHMGVTLSEALLGFAIGSSLGIATGMAIGYSRLFERVSYPYIVALQSMPKVALAPLLVIWFGFGIQGKVVIVAVMTFFPLLVNSISGYRGVDPDRIDLARACNASGFRILLKIILPSALPSIFAGLSVASVLALIGALVGEFVGARAGLGVLLMQYNQMMQTGPLFAVLVVLIVLGFVMNLSIRSLERRVCFWAQRNQASGNGQ